jgi:hypothetical protein
MLPTTKSVKPPWEAFVTVGAIAIVGLFFLIPQLNSLNGFTNKPIIIGSGIGEIGVKKTTLAEIISLLGPKYQLTKNEDGIIAKCLNGVCEQIKFTDIKLDYTDFGLMFNFRSILADNVPENELKLRSINITCVQKLLGCAFSGKTEKGSRLGSSRKEVEAAEGKSDTWTGQQGAISKRAGLNITFKSEYLKLSENDPVEAFTIFAPSDFDEFGQRSGS